MGDMDLARPLGLAGIPCVAVARPDDATGFSRFASEIAQEQLNMTPHKKQELDTMLQLVDEAEAIIASPDRPLNEFGRLLHESWKIKRTLTQRISNASIDEIYDAGLSAGGKRCEELEK